MSRNEGVARVLKETRELSARGAAQHGVFTCPHLVSDFISLPVPPSASMTCMEIFPALQLSMVNETGTLPVSWGKCMAVGIATLVLPHSRKVSLVPLMLKINII